ncbi:hypothetical protein [Companilactobacillus sp.]|jgi:hypothetical protein|uniref:hypothetical protein n=1 Tax=Companilactobacillus sp. TaxID=2767905 RepID=UPI0025BF42C0|nr:hypothetical protein [Companilactobacillus sp.]MCH4009778.1 hypothetical protein [Companilactobacillus sp.]MCH4052546.1 hypothetical protein [Companilactobacillus sp.]MCH4077720.1 hypothetical protein [Companilactobacillus sp.]MCH4126296.1 hypothetical protein [Companilactobacillus sp.]MCI1312004.1 hypothetical protein [Companilactobacillus sp.]
MVKVIVAMDLSDVPIVDSETEIYTVLSKNNKKWANDHKGVGIQFIKMPAYIKVGDKVVNTFVQKALKIKDNYNDMLRFVYFSHLVSYYISQRKFDLVVFENQYLCEKVLMQFNNSERYQDQVEIL